MTLPRAIRVGGIYQIQSSPSANRRIPMNPEAHGIIDRVLQDGEGLYANELAAHSDPMSMPAGSPPLTAFLGVPLS